MDRLKWQALGYTVLDAGVPTVKAEDAFDHITELEEELAKWKPQPKFKPGQFVRIENFCFAYEIHSMEWSAGDAVYRYKLVQNSGSYVENRLRALTPAEKGD